jgi:hypothetical protein
MKTFTTYDVSFCGKRSRMSLSETRSLANALDREVAKAGRSIGPNTSKAELAELFKLAVKGLNIPLTTPTGRDRDIFSLKWRTFSKFNLTSSNEEEGKSSDEQQQEEGKRRQLPTSTRSPAPAQVEQEDGGIYNWLYEHEDGVKRKVPSTWKFPMVGLQDIYILWNCKDEQQKIMPMKMFNSSDVSFLHKGSKNLAEVRGMMTLINKEAARKW